MVEYIRRMTLSLEIDTNKRTETYTRELDSLDDVVDDAEWLRDQAAEGLPE